MPERSPVRIAAAKAPFWPGIRAWMCAEAAMRSAEGELPQVATGPARRPRPSASGHSRPRRSARTRRRGGSRSRRAPTGAAGGDEPRLAEQPQAGPQELGRRRGIERDRAPAPASAPARARGSPRGRAAPAAGRWPSGRGRSTRPSTFAVISCGSTGAATIRLRSAAAAEAEPPAGAARGAAPAPTGPARNSVAEPDEKRRRRAPPASRPRGSAGSGEVERDAEREEHRDPEREVRALRLDQRRRDGRRPRPLFSRADLA